MKCFKVALVSLVGSLFSALPLLAQISAQGQGGKDVLWTALGIEQKMGQHGVSKTAIAYSRHSDLEHWDITQQPGVFTIREELFYKLSRKFKCSQGLMYAERYYQDAEHPKAVQEVRLYPKLYHEFDWRKIHWSHYLRIDWRFFSSPGFQAYAKPFEFRNRYLIKAQLPLTSNSKKVLVGMTEFFFATDQIKRKDGSFYFTDYRFTENRTSFYLRHRMQKIDAWFDAGVMIQTWRASSEAAFRQTYILQLDLILINPFSN